MGVSRAELSLVFVNDREIERLNRKWRGLDKPTDVLAFAQREGEFADPDDPMLGDIVISVETAGRQAEEMGHSLEEEIDILIIHGLLHLLGYEHTRGGKSAKKMRAKEKELDTILKK